jgi:hypothetical protein
MKLQVFSIYDSKIEAYMPPFFLKSIGEAKRVLGDAVLDPKSALSQHPEDYTLFHLGSWDDTDAQFAPTLSPESVCVLLELKSSLSES